MNNFDDRSRPHNSGCLLPSRVARAAKALPPELAARLPELFVQYLNFQASDSDRAAHKAGDVITINEKSYVIGKLLGSGDEGVSYLAKDAHENCIVKVLNNPQNVELHRTEADRSTGQGIPVVKVLDHDTKQGILVLEAKLGIPFSYLLQSDKSNLNAAESEAILELFLAFKERHSLVGLFPGNLAIDPVNRGMFVFDLF